MKSLKEFQDAYSKLVKDFAKDGKKLFEEEVQKVFEDNPELYAIGWTQSTPSFNDGDPCTFGVSEIHYLTKKAHEDKDSEYNFNSDVYEWIYPSYNNPEYEFGDITDNWQFLEIAFGDGVQVKATREGIHLEEYYDY